MSVFVKAANVADGERLEVDLADLDAHAKAFNWDLTIAYKVKKLRR